MGTKIECSNAVLEGSILTCKVSKEPCAYQMWCGLVGHATNLVKAKTMCPHFKEGVYCEDTP